MSTESNKAEEIVKQYALGLSTMNLDLIVPILYPEFKFVYRTGYNNMGHGITTDVRYIGILYKVFSEMRNEGLSIDSDFCYLEREGSKYLSVKLLPPHDRRIIFPMEYQIIESAINRVPEGEVYLLPRVKNGLLCKVECYCTLSELAQFGVIIN